METKHREQPEEISGEQVIPQAEPLFPKGVPLEMYEISGQDEITEHGFERYLKNKNQDDAIREEMMHPSPPKKIKMAERESTGASLFFSAEGEEENLGAELNFRERILLAKGDERARLVVEGLDNPDKEIQNQSAEMISLLTDKQQIPLRKIIEARVLNGLSNADLEIQKESADMIIFVSDEDRASLVSFGLKNPNMEIQGKCLGFVDMFVPENQRAALVWEAMENKNVQIQRVASLMIRNVPEKDKDNLIRFGLASPDPEVIYYSADAIEGAPFKVQNSLRSIVSEKIIEGLNGPNPEMQKVCARMIEHAPDKDKVDLIRFCMESENGEAQAISAGNIWYAPYSKRIALINEGMDSNNIKVKKVCAEMIGLVPEEKMFPLIKKAFLTNDLDIKKSCVLNFKSVPDEHKQEFLKMIVDNNLGEFFVQPPLYGEKTVDAGNFSREKLHKTGSETILFGGELKGKAILRRIKPEAFLSWQKIYENYALWKQAGFEYVPIEPIISYRLNSEGLVDVWSGVLDTSLSRWEQKCDLFKGELKIQKEKILDVLNAPGVEVRHGHPHDGNFCLRFFRDEETGKVDFNRCPRLYMIDFDQAVSP